MILVVSMQNNWFNCVDCWGRLENLGFDHRMISMFFKWKTRHSKNCLVYIDILLVLCGIYVYVWPVQVTYTFWLCDAPCSSYRQENRHISNISWNCCSHIFYRNRQFQDRHSQWFSLTISGKRNETGKEMMCFKWKGQVLARELIGRHTIKIETYSM